MCISLSLYIYIYIYIYTHTSVLYFVNTIAVGKSSPYEQAVTEEPLLKARRSGFLSSLAKTVCVSSETPRTPWYNVTELALSPNRLL